MHQSLTKVEGTYRGGAAKHAAPQVGSHVSPQVQGASGLLSNEFKPHLSCLAHIQAALHWLLQLHCASLLAHENRAVSVAGVRQAARLTTLT